MLKNYWSKWYTWFVDFGDAIEEWSVCGLCVGLDIFWFRIYSVGLMEIIKTGKDVISDGLSWVAIGIFLHVGVG